MKKNTVVTFLLFCISLTLYAQDSINTNTDKKWKINNFLHLGINGSFISNWTAGGESGLSLQSIAKLNANYTNKKILFKTELDLIYGLASQYGKFLLKSNDLIQLESEFNYKIKEKLYLHFATHLTTQFSAGYIYSEDASGALNKTKYSSFLSPGLAHEGLGINYIIKDFELGLSPIAMKQTIIIANEIDPSFYGMEKHGIRNEFGAYLNSNLSLSLFKDKLTCDADFMTFLEYGDPLKDLDMHFKYLLTYNISKLFSIHSSMFMLYDTDSGRPNLIDTDGNGIVDTLAGSSSKVQIKQILSIGCSANF